MGDKTGIGWTNSTWNSFVGCSIVSPGCVNCYAQKQAYRITQMNPDSHYHGTVKLVKGKAIWTGVVKPAPEHIFMKPLHWKRPRRIFVNSMSDMFHESMPLDLIFKVIAVMAMAHWHQFQVLTKRASLMREVLSDPDIRLRVQEEMNLLGAQFTAIPWPLPNVWWGVSAERELEFLDRVEHLRETPAAIRFISAEPLIGEISMVSHLDKIDWVIIGGESGDDAREIRYSWIQRIMFDCWQTNTKVFVKQLGARPVYDIGLTGIAHNVHLKHRKGEDMTEWPEQFRVQDYPDPGVIPGIKALPPTDAFPLFSLL